MRLCPFGCKNRETAEHFALECGRTLQIVVLTGINVNGISDLDNIYGEASEGSPTNKLKERDLMVTAAYWFI
jgi:hypothetical protein